MRLNEYHESSNVGYLSLSEDAPSSDRLRTVEKIVLVDIDREGNIYGIEFLDATDLAHNEVVN